MELGNMTFGNSRGSVPIERWTGYEAELDRLVEAIEGKPDCYGVEFENDTFEMRPYYWGEDEEEAAKPNFRHKRSGLEVQWYKYRLRDAYLNRKCSLEEFAEIIDDCIESL